jgi:hypothetical protein
MKVTYHKYDSLWDTLFFGIGITDLNNWDEVNTRILPEAINPLTFGYDPFFPDKTDDWRYYWKWILMPKHKLLALQKAGKLYVNVDELPDGVEPTLWSYKADLDKSKGASPTSPTSSSTNNIYQILDIYTILDNGKRVRLWLDKDLAKIIALDVDIPQDRWNIVVKKVNRVPHSSINPSKVDVIEDKHRSFGAILNLINIKAKDWATPIYEYDVNKVKDKNALLQRQVNQHIPVESIGAISPLTKDPPIDNPTLAFLELLKSEARDGVGLPSGIMGRKKMSATESAIRQQISDTVSFIDIGLLVMSEIEFWKNWYKTMKGKLKKDSKIKTSLSNPQGELILEQYTKVDIIAEQPITVQIISSSEKEYKDLVLRRDLMQQLPVLIKTLPQSALKNFLKFFYFPKFVPDTKMLNVIYPKTIDEIKAEQENAILEKDDLTPVSPNDNDEEHLAVHYRAKSTSATWSHIYTHERQYSIKKGREKELAEQQAMQGGKQPQQQEQKADLLPTMGGRKQMPRGKTNPLDVATPSMENFNREIFSQKI